MAIIQTIVFICDKCGRVQVKTERGLLYSDPVVECEGWDEANGDLTCPICSGNDTEENNITDEWGIDRGKLNKNTKA